MIVSNTEVTSYSLCKRQHYYRFVRDLEPRYLSRALFRGIVGHEALEVYYREMQEGSPLELCKAGMLSVVENHIKRLMVEEPDEFERIQLLHYLRKLLNAYAEYYSTEPFKVLEVEKEFATSVDDEINYGLKLDLLIEFTKGEHRGDVAVLDHKFPYNFKTQLEIDMDGQLPKYQKTVKDSGIYVTGGYLNQIRYREMINPKPEQLFRRTPLKSKRVKTDRIWEEQRELAEEIAVIKQSTKYDPPRTLSLLVCRSCFFQPLCITELIGEDTTQMISTNYQKNTYGYVDLGEE